MFSTFSLYPLERMPEMETCSYVNSERAEELWTLMKKKTAQYFFFFLREDKLSILVTFWF